MLFLHVEITAGATRSSVPGRHNSRISLKRYSALSRVIPLGDITDGKGPGCGALLLFLRMRKACSSEYQYWVVFVKAEVVKSF